MSKVLKFGGTSVGSAENMRRVAQIIQDEASTITVLSAMSGTTDGLVKICQLAEAGNAAEIAEVVATLKKKYTDCVAALELSAYGEQAAAIIANGFGTIEREAATYKTYTSERIIVAQGELMTSAIFTLLLQQMGLKAALLNAPDFIRTDDSEKVDMELLREKLTAATAQDNTFYITQGFICTNYRDEIDNLGRGGSDHSAAVMGAAIHAAEVQIWTDIDGMHNNDPRFVTGTYLIRKMSYDEAAELAYFGAKILHPATMKPCKVLNIPVKLKNTMDPQAAGTTISAEEDNTRDFLAVAAKDGITVIRIHSAGMLMAYGFLRKVFEIFENHRTPIDMITTAEVSVSLTIDNDKHLEEIVAELEELGRIEVEQNNTIICLVGSLEYNKVGIAASVMDSMHNVPIKMISYGASNHCVTMLIDTKYKKETLQSLNDHLFTQNA